jgi:hypothetical protein
MGRMSLLVFLGYLILNLVLFTSAKATPQPIGAGQNYGERLCLASLEYECHVVGKKLIYEELKDPSGQVSIVTKEITETWENLFIDPSQRNLAQRLNRQNTRLKTGSIIVLPPEEDWSYLDYSPFPRSICPYDYEEQICKIPELELPANITLPVSDETCYMGKTLIFDPELLAFAAYDDFGNLVHWGPASGGKTYCPDVKRACATPPGQYKMAYKVGPNYRSKTYPLGCHGQKCAAIPYAIFFNDGAAFHASSNLPGRNDSHGCVRLFYDDAKWLNQEFVDKDTTIIIKPYNN